MEFSEANIPMGIVYVVYYTIAVRQRGKILGGWRNEVDWLAAEFEQPDKCY